jgi:hypothetical protein
MMDWKAAEENFYFARMSFKTNIQLDINLRVLGKCLLCLCAM